MTTFADDNHVIRVKSAEQPLNGPRGEISVSAAVPRSGMNLKYLLSETKLSVSWRLSPVKLSKQGQF